jgi:hypothetical protein
MTDPEQGKTYIVRYLDRKPEVMQWGCGGHNVWRNCAGTISDPEDITMLSELDVEATTRSQKTRLDAICWHIRGLIEDGPARTVVRPESLDHAVFLLGQSNKKIQQIHAVVAAPGVTKPYTGTCSRCLQDPAAHRALMSAAKVALVAIEPMMDYVGQDDEMAAAVQGLRDQVGERENPTRRGTP